MEGLPVNDGGGLYDNNGLCDSLINDLNNIFRQLMNGQHLAACIVATNMANKIVNLKSGIKNDTDSLTQKIEELKRMLSEKDGAENGCS